MILPADTPENDSVKIAPTDPRLNKSKKKKRKKHKHSKSVDNRAKNKNDKQQKMVIINQLRIPKEDVPGCLATPIFLLRQMLQQQQQKDQLQKELAAEKQKQSIRENVALLRSISRTNPSDNHNDNNPANPNQHSHDIDDYNDMASQFDDDADAHMNDNTSNAQDHLYIVHYSDILNTISYSIFNLKNRPLIYPVASNKKGNKRHKVIFLSYISLEPIYTDTLLNDEQQFNHSYSPQSQISKTLHNEFFTLNNIAVTSPDGKDKITCCWFSGAELLEILPDDESTEMAIFYKCNYLPDPEFGSNSLYVDPFD